MVKSRSKARSRSRSRSKARSRSRSRSKSRSKSRSRSRMRVKVGRSRSRSRGRMVSQRETSRAIYPAYWKGIKRVRKHAPGYEIAISCSRGKVYNPDTDRCISKSSRTGKALHKKLECFKKAQYELHKAQKAISKCGRGLGRHFI